ncbi:MAG: hypothetical protein NVS3B5_02580 [Sphingomicrobium sp.]
MPHDPLIRAGEVWLVGAGPGNPDLLTRKAEKLIRAADVIFYDALVGEGVLALADGAKLMFVGKRSGRHSKDQRSINQLLIEASKAGLRVIRLKGGDPSIFARSGEEIAELTRHGVIVRICPGITAASAAAASAGVSLTLRGVARRLEFVTAHARSGEHLDLDWNKIAASDATLAVYMGKSAAIEVARNLMKAGLDGATAVLAVENASMPSERIFSTRLDLLALVVRTAMGNGPVVLLIGEAVALPDRVMANSSSPAVARV